MAFWEVWSKRRGALCFVLLGLLGFALTIYLCAPGYMSADSGDQLEQARNLRFRDDNPVLMALLWRFTDQVIEGPLGMLLFTSALHWAALGVVCWVIDGPLWARAGALVGVGFYPPTFANIPAIWKDTLTQTALMAAVACLILPIRRWQVVRYALALMFFVIGLGARHNAAAGLWPLIALPLLQLPVLLQRPKWLRLLVAFAASLVVTLLLTVGLDRSLSPLAKRTDFWQMIPVFDLAGMSVIVGENLVDPESGVLTPGMGVKEMRRFYQVNYVPRLYYCMAFRGRRCVPLFRQTADPEALAALSDNWRRAILAHPMAYFQHRREVVKALLGIENGAPGTFYMWGAPHHPVAASYPPPERAVRLFNWIDGQCTKLWFKPWLYVLIGIILIPVTFFNYQRSPARDAPGQALSVFPLLLVLSGLSYMLGLFVSTGSGPYRYTVWTSFCIVVALAATVVPLLGRGWVRRHGHVSAPGSSRPLAA
jgi:hypothetical protein